MSSPEYGYHYSTWQYQKIVPMQRIEYIHNLSDKDGNPVDPVSVGILRELQKYQRYTVTFKDLGQSKTEMTVTEHNWTVGQMMDMSKMGLEQCLDKMSASFARA